MRKRTAVITGVLAALLATTALAQEQLPGLPRHADDARR
jgi:hypothetical protein